MNGFGIFGEEVEFNNEFNRWKWTTMFEMGMVRIRFTFMPLPLFRRNSRKKTDTTRCMCMTNLAGEQLTLLRLFLCGKGPTVNSVKLYLFYSLDARRGEADPHDA